MALVGPGAMTEYTGGPRSSRRRGFVTVNEPAQGFFITGSSIDAMNGVYGRVRPQSIWSAHNILLAYKNDNKPNWIMALVEAQSFRTSRPRHPYTDYSDDSDEDYVDEKREWLFIDADCRDRFMHDGDTIIPGAGVNWKHVHRGSVRPKKKSGQRGFDDSDSDYDYNDDNVACTALQEQVPDDEDELPWQIVAILDYQTMRDMRYTQRCYDQDIRDAISGVNLPKPCLADLDDLASSGRWLFKVTAARGVEVRSSPESGAPTVAWRDHGEYVQGVELRGNWLRLPGPVEHENDEICSDDDDSLQLWVQLEDAEHEVRLMRVAEEDVPNMDSELPDDPQADIFDRPFEPMLEDANMKEEEDAVDEEVSGNAEVCQPDSSDPAPASLPSLEIAHELGTEVMLEGLTKDSFNGQHATIVTRPTEDGRQGVRLTASGQKISVKVVNLRPILSSETGPLARHARVLGLTLQALGLQTERQEMPSNEDRPLPSASAAEELMAAALRAAQRDTQHEAQGAHRDLQVAYDELKAALTNREGAGEANSEKSQDQAKPRAPHECVEQGVLGSRAAKAAKLAGDAESIDTVKEGVGMLRQLLLDEQSRVHRASKDVDDRGKESADSLRLRLTLVRALLRCRRESEASSEADVARRLHASSSAAILWHGRCLLRAGRRQEGLKSLSAAATAPDGPDAAWASTDSKMRLKALQLSERHEQRAKTSYGRGMFEEAARHYSEAIANADIVADDKWSRAELHANRAACYRRARDFKAAIGDLDIALSLFPCYKRAHFRRSVCLLEAGNPKDAVVALETLMGLDREWPNLLDWIVRAHALDRRQSSGKYRRGGDYFSQGMPGFTSNGGWAEAPEENDIASEKNHYTVLGVPADATDKQLKKAYRIMSLKFHPDKEGGSTRAFQRIATAYQTLSDPEKRQLYDEGADLKKGDGGSESDSDEEREHRSLREEIERKYFPERYKFWPFGDPFVQKRKRQERQRQRAGRPAWYEEDI